MFSQRFSRPAAWCVALLLGAGAYSGVALADDPDPPTRVARVGYLKGNVSFQPSGDDQWAEVALNRPLGTGDKVYTDKDSRVELEIGAASIRLEQGSTFTLLNLDDKTAQIELTDGIVNLHIDRLYDGQSYEVDTPTLAFVVRQPGDYRIDVAPQGDSTMVTVPEGAGDVYGENNASYSVRAGNSYRFNDSALHDYEVLDLPQADDFDQWCRSRNVRVQRSVSRQYVSEDVVGYADLDDNGSWSSTPEYGQVWYPTTVAADWAPYRSGHWSWVDPWGWTWIDSAAWGFAPFHYGRWAYVGNRWGWCPGERVGRSVYAPALVAFVGGGGWGSGVSVGIGGGPVGWFPLGPRDVYVPWYRSSRSYFTNVNVRNTTVINNVSITNVYNNYSRGGPITNVNYAYRSNPAALTAVSRETFVGSRAVGNARVQVDPANFRNAQVVSRIGIAPTQASFAATAGRGRPAPANLVDRRVIARSAPPAAAAPIASRIQAIERNGGQAIAAPRPVATAGRGGPNVPATANSRVQVVGQNAPKPQPLPARAPGAPNQAAGRGGAPASPAVPSRTAPPAATRAPAGAPGAAMPNPAQRVSPATTPSRDSLPSSRFAPRQGSAASGNPAATRVPSATDRGASAPATRGNVNPQAPSRSPAGAAPRTSPFESGTPSRTAPVDRGVQSRTPSPQVARPAERQAPVQRSQQTSPTPQRSTQPAPVQRSTPAYQPQRSTPAAPAAQQYRQPAPQVQRNNPAPVQRATPPPVQRQVQPAPPVQQRQAPVPQQRTAPAPRPAPDKNKDRDRR